LSGAGGGSLIVEGDVGELAVAVEALLLVEVLLTEVELAQGLGLGLEDGCVGVGLFGRS
jgi:hypothetical protein